MSNGRLQECNTFLDILLALQKFNRDNQDFFFFVLRNLHSGFNKINWTRTISKSQAVVQDDVPIYLHPVNKRRQANFDEELLVIFFSILNYIHHYYGFPVSIPVNYELITGTRFEAYLNGRGRMRLLSIKNKYFSDKAVYLWELCYAFFDLSRRVKVEASNQEYILVKNFNIVFEAIIETKEVDKSYMKLNAYNYYYFIYGGVHIEASDDVKMILDDSRTINFSNDKKKIFVDIINIYNDGSEIEKNSGLTKRINNIEKYLVYPYNDRFQIFVSSTKDNPNINIENENQYFQKYVGNLINFDLKSMYYEAKKIILMSDNFVLVPTFFEKIKIRYCTYFEIAFDAKERDLYTEDNENRNEEEINSEYYESEEKKDIQKILETDKTTSFNIKISTFLDLNSKGN